MCTFTLLSLPGRHGHAGAGAVAGEHLPAAGGQHQQRRVAPRPAPVPPGHAPHRPAHLQISTVDIRLLVVDMYRVARPRPRHGGRDARVPRVGDLPRLQPRLPAQHPAAGAEEPPPQYAHVSKYQLSLYFRPAAAGVRPEPVEGVQHGGGAQPPQPEEQPHLLTHGALLLPTVHVVAAADRNNRC